jgi:hypothetical protein
MLYTWTGLQCSFRQLRSRKAMRPTSLHTLDLDSTAGVGLKRQKAKKNVFADAQDELQESEEEELDVLPDLPALAKSDGLSESTQTASSSSSSSGRYSISRSGLRRLFLVAVR